jgi:hypothetical protein
MEINYRLKLLEKSMGYLKLNLQLNSTYPKARMPNMRKEDVQFLIV